MEVYRTKTFGKMYKKLPRKIQVQFEARLELFLQYPTHPILHVHSLLGEYEDMWSMNVTGDYRALFYKDNETVVIFALIGTHSELYG
ncbi:hypothetical protein COU14_01745 [Candidatus Kaiserbacteria bacterium CG10_big_fil_rev_8_21_14_0_10_44_10]|uniref:Type II toxin-antitoxin system mRNA interferase toxin, RelE/StbE family n=1 Tax=Candidatus Kaiserbacteria bacterium CG10_big_fil_rev_8_21_14_0_10_44_10 TaxID=1974606 RepID=A0A2H0UHP1_9BACT|nr:MAG: hypothetical protein COU14_01745 [Candidatus Kaiserbacteria bacterium CG10_big_fil_rev_8_21_14_0_10_44_10]